MVRLCFFSFFFLQDHHSRSWATGPVEAGGFVQPELPRWDLELGPPRHPVPPQERAHMCTFPRLAIAPYPRSHLGLGQSPGPSCGLRGRSWRAWAWRDWSPQARLVRDNYGTGGGVSSPCGLNRSLHGSQQAKGVSPPRTSQLSVGALIKSSTFIPSLPEARTRLAKRQSGLGLVTLKVRRSPPDRFLELHRDPELPQVGPDGSWSRAGPGGRAALRQSPVERLREAWEGCPSLREPPRECGE